MRNCLDYNYNYYYANDLLNIMNIKRELLMSLYHYAKIYLLRAKIEQFASQTIRT